jgi:DNA-binding transcriptional LysR family regulator
MSRGIVIYGDPIQAVEVMSILICLMISLVFLKYFMELRQLNSFCWIVQSGSLKDAAKRCFLTRSAISLQIKALEHELALKLFDYKGRKLALTRRVKSFTSKPKRCSTRSKRQRKKPKIMRPISAGNLSRGSGVPALSLSASFARFRATYPAIKLSVITRSHADAISMARSGEADLAMDLFPHSFVDLEDIPLITPKLTLIIPRRGVRFVTKTNRLERAVTATDGLVAVRHHHKSSDRWSIPEKQSQDAR